MFFAGTASAQAGLPAAAGSEPLQVPDTIAQRVQACTPCHGREGRATNEGFFPRIAGKPAGYLYNQLVHFREGRRRYAAMTYLVEHLSDDYLREIAEYFAALDLPYPPPQRHEAATATPVRGEVLVRQGDAARGVPACTRCHGDALTGVAPAMPGLLGLPRDYVIGQFGAGRTGARRAAAPDCMASIAGKLSSEEIAAAASWLAAQPLPADTRPAASLARALPIECGSMPARVLP